MKKELIKIIVIVEFAICVINFNTFKTYSTAQISKCINFLSNNSQSSIGIYY